MTISEMRLYVMNLYPDRLWWHEKVSRMPTKQVIAIYQTYKNKEERDTKNHYHQIDLWEYLASQSQNHTEVEV